MAVVAVVVASCLTAAGPGRAAPAEPVPDPREWAITMADQAVQENPSAIRGAPGDEYTVFSSIVDPSGAAHVRYTRSFQGLRVHGGDFVVHLAPGGGFASATAGLTSPVAVNTTPTISAAAAAATATATFTGTVESVGPPELIVDASSGTGRLAWETVVRGLAPNGQLPSRLHVITDAVTGEQVGSFDEIKTVEGTGHGIYSGTVKVNTTYFADFQEYLLNDPAPFGEACDARNQDINTCIESFEDTDNVWGNGTVGNRQSAGVDAHYGAAVMYDYLNSVHGRNGIYGNVGRIRSRVHYGNDFAEAFWDGDYVVYGDGADNAKPLVSLDIAGHEATHALTERLVPGGLEYTGESGGLNEATSDIFGTMVEFHAANSNDAGDFVIGEKVDANGDGTPMRYMYDPALDGQSDSCWSPETKDKDVHFSSGVANHFFFNLVMGTDLTFYGRSPICGSALPVKGIGSVKAARIWFRALEAYFTSTTKYFNTANFSNTARAATLAAAADLYGGCSVEYRAVQLAWSAVNVTTGLDFLCPLSLANPGSLTNVANSSVSRALQLSGGYAPYQWSVAGLPAGLSMHPTLGFISGTPTVPGTYGVSVTVTDGNGRTSSTSFTWQILLAVPDLRGKTLAQATSTLQAVGLQVGTVGTTPVDESIDGGKVRIQSPPAGTQVTVGTAINLYLGQWNGSRK